MSQQVICNDYHPLNGSSLLYLQNYMLELYDDFTQYFILLLLQWLNDLVGMYKNKTDMLNLSNHYAQMDLQADNW